MNTILVCSECGSDNIQVLAWVDANTNKYVCEGGGSIDDNWCNDCDDHVRFDLVDAEEFICKQIAEGK